MLEHFDQGCLERSDKPKGAAEGEYWWNLVDTDLYLFFLSDDSGVCVAVDPDPEEEATSQGVFLTEEDLRPFCDLLTKGLASMGQ